jgi:hypothetical protein
MFSQFLNQNKNIFSVFAVLSLLTVAGVSLYNNATDSTFQAETALSTQQQYDLLADFYNPTKFDAKWNAYKPALIKEVTDLYNNKTFKKPLDVNGFRRAMYIVSSVGVNQPQIARGLLFTPSEYTCFFNNLSTALDALDCPLQKTGKYTGTINFYAKLPKDSVFRSKSDNLLRTYSDWYYKNVTPTLRTLGTKLGKL